MRNLFYQRFVHPVIEHIASALVSAYLFIEKRRTKLKKAGSNNKIVQVAKQHG